MIESILILLVLFIIFRNTFSSSSFDGSKWYREEQEKLEREREQARQRQIQILRKRQQLEED